MMLPGRPTRSLIAILALAAIGSAAVFLEVLWRPTKGPSQLEIRTTPHGNAAGVSVSWQDGANHALSIRTPVEHTGRKHRWRIEVLPLPGEPAKTKIRHDGVEPAHPPLRSL